MMRCFGYRNDQARHDYRLRADIRNAFTAFIDETAGVLHGEGWRDRTLVESKFDPNPLRGYTGVSALSVESRRAISGVSPSLVNHALSRLSGNHAEYFEFERHTIEQAGGLLAHLITTRYWAATRIAKCNSTVK